MPACSQCGKPALFQVNEIYLCVDCNLKYEQAIQLKLNRNIDYLNYLAAQMEVSTGLPLGTFPRMAKTDPRIGSDKMTFNNFKIDGSTIGAINAGNIRNLDVALTQISQQGEKAIVDGLKNLTEAVIQSQEIDNVLKDEILELLSYVASQAATPKEQGSKTVSQTVLDRLQRLLDSAANLATLWTVLAPLLLHLFK